MNASGGQVFRLGAAEIDPGMACIRRDGVTLHLRPKTLQVLMLLVDHCHRVVTKQELMDAVWSNAAIDDDGLVQCIAEIRRAFQDDPRNPRVIRTYPKTGYQFIGSIEPCGELTGQTPGALPVPLPSPDPPHLRIRWKRVPAIVSVALLMATAWLASHYGSPVAAGAASTARPPGVSIAVLPFTNLTGSSEYEYLTDGLTDELTSALVEMQGLRVVARSSTYHFKGKSEDVRSVGRQLKTAAIMEGSVRLSDRGLRIIAQLSSASDGYELWSKTYEVATGDLSATVGDLSREVAGKLKLDLRAGAFRPRHIDSESHDLYLKGRYLWNQRTQGSVRKSVEYFERAITREPEYALAYAGLADSYSVWVADGWPEARDLAHKAKAAARQAIDLDPALADPHAALGLILSAYDWNWRGAELESKRAITMNPNSPAAHHWLGTHLLRLLRFPEALQELETAQSLDPLSLMISTNLAGVYIAMQRYGEAGERLHAILELDPNFAAARLALGVALAGERRYDDALREFGQTFPQSSLTDQLYYTVYIRGLSGQRHEARQLLRQLEVRSNGNPDLTYDLAGLHAVLGDKDRAFELLDSAATDRSRLADLQLDTRFAKFHDDPRYLALVKKIGFPR